MLDSISFVRPLPPSRPLTFAARPLPVVLDLSRTALIIVDMQNDFAHPDGWFGARGLPTAQTIALVPMINSLAAALRTAEVPVIWLNWGVRPDLAEMPRTLVARGRLNAGVSTYGDASPSGKGRILVEGEWGAKLLAPLLTDPGDLFVSKSRFSGFANNALDALLRKRDVTTLLFAGINTDRCVFSTLQDAGTLGYDCVLLADASATSSDTAAVGAIHDLVMRLYGVVATAADLISALPTPADEVKHHD